jgi:hypothetical protein
VKLAPVRTLIPVQIVNPPATEIELVTDAGEEYVREARGRP